MKRVKTYGAARLAQTAVMLATAAMLAFLSELIPFFHLPFGGTFTLASMLPVIIVAYRFGTGWGLFGAVTYSVIQMAMSFKTVGAFFLPGSSQLTLWKALTVCLLDYVAAYTVLGFGGVFRNKLKNPSAALCAGSVFALLLRYLAHIVSGAIFFGAWAEWFFTQEGFYRLGGEILSTFSGARLSVVYSIFYNGLYMIPEIVITAVAALFVAKLPQIGLAHDNKKA